MTKGWTLLSIRGIPIRIQPSWFLTLTLVTVLFNQHFRTVFDQSVGDVIVLGVSFGTSLLLFLSLLMHELGHSVVAMSQGIKVLSITLIVLGGVAKMERESDTPRGAIMVAAAGPLVSLALALAFSALIHPARHVSAELVQVAHALFQFNLIAGLFNLLPALPLDGGLILKAVIWQFSGSRKRGVEVANTCGWIFSCMSIGIGLILLFATKNPAGLWFMLLGWFGLGASRNQGQVLLVQQALKDLKVKDAAMRRFRVIEANTSLRQLSQIRQRIDPATDAEDSSLGDWILVCDQGRWRGVIDDHPLKNLPVQTWNFERVDQHVRPLDSMPCISEKAPLWQAALQLDDEQTSRLLVLSPAGLPNGTLEKPELGETVLRRIGLTLPKAFVQAARREQGYPFGMALDEVARSMVRSGEVTLPVNATKS